MEECPKCKSPDIELGREAFDPDAPQKERIPYYLCHACNHSFDLDGTEL